MDGEEKKIKKLDGKQKSTFILSGWSSFFSLRSLLFLHTSSNKKNIMTTPCVRALQQYHYDIQAHTRTLPQFTGRYDYVTENFKVVATVRLFLPDISLDLEYVKGAVCDSVEDARESAAQIAMQRVERAKRIAARPPFAENLRRLNARHSEAFRQAPPLFCCLADEQQTHRIAVIFAYKDVASAAPNTVKFNMGLGNGNSLEEARQLAVLDALDKLDDENNTALLDSEAAEQLRVMAIFFRHFIEKRPQ
jgi:hypothetical protein